MYIYICVYIYIDALKPHICIHIYIDVLKLLASTAGCKCMYICVYTRVYMYVYINSLILWPILVV